MMRRFSRAAAVALTGFLVIANLVHAPVATAATIAIIGTDDVANALGPEFAALGHRVVYGSRNPDRDKVRDLVGRTGVGASATGQAEAAAAADIVVLAVPWDVIAEVVDNLGDLSGKIIIDPTNPRSVLDDGLRWHARELSNAELLQQWAPDAFVVKAFNTMSAHTMAEPWTAGGPVSVPIVGNDADAKRQVAALIAGMGLEPVDLGPVRYARLVEGLYYLRSNARMFGREFNYDLRRVPASAEPPGWTRIPVMKPGWTTPFPPLRIIGDLYYVGTFELASFLVTTPDGHILINSGAYGSEHLIRSNVEALDFDFTDVEVLLTTQAHPDHVAGLAAIKRMTGARLYAHAGDVASLEDGGVSDFRSPRESDAVFEPVAVDKVLQHGDRIELGDTIVTLLHHPGHTRGASSFVVTTRDEERDFEVLVVNMGSVNPGVTLLGMEQYPNIADDYVATFAAQKALKPDVWVSSHARHFRLHDKYRPGDPYDPERFHDPEGYAEMIGIFEQRFSKQLEEERAAARQAALRPRPRRIVERQ